jgi:hypothetical protein
MRIIDADALKEYFESRLVSVVWGIIERRQTMNNDLISREALKKAIRKRLSISSLKYLTEQEKVIVEEIDNAPTIEMSYDLYREETCERKAHCYDYKYWHCIGCHGCKADVRGEGQ